MRGLEASTFGIRERVLSRDSTVLSPRVRTLLDWWHGAGQGQVPAWDRFDAAEHPALLPNVFLVRREGEGFRFRLHGEAAVRIMGRNPRGVLVSADAPKGFHRYLHGYFTRVVDSGRCWGCTGRMPTDGLGFQHFESIDAPFSRQRHEVDTILGVIDTIDAPEAAA